MQMQAIPRTPFLFCSQARARISISAYQVKRFIRNAVHKPHRMVQRSCALQMRVISRMRSPRDLRSWINTYPVMSDLLSECWGKACPYNRLTSPTIRAHITRRVLSELHALRTHTQQPYMHIAVIGGGGLLHETMILSTWLQAVITPLTVQIDLVDPGYEQLHSAHPEAQLYQALQNLRLYLCAQIVTQSSPYASVSAAWSTHVQSQDQYGYVLQIDSAHDQNAYAVQPPSSNTRT